MNNNAIDNFPICMKQIQLDVDKKKDMIRYMDKVIPKIERKKKFLNLMNVNYSRLFSGLKKKQDFTNIYTVSKK